MNEPEHTIEEVVVLAKANKIRLHPSLLKEYPLGTLFYCIHHSELVEPLTEPLVNRLWVILVKKASSERRVRLLAIRPVKTLSENLVRASAEYDRARTEYSRARTELDRARTECDRAYTECDWLKTWKHDYPHHPKWDAEGLVFPT